MAELYTKIRGGFRAAKGQRKSAQDKMMSRQEFAALLGCAGSDKSRHGGDAYDLFALAGNFALRCSECLELNFDHFKQINLGYFRVHTLKKRSEGSDRVYTGEHGLNLAIKILERRRKNGTDLLFPFSSRTARYLFGFYSDLAGLSPNVSFHSLRHTAAKMMLEAIGGKIDYPERIVNAFLRHKPTTTEIYLTPSAEDMTYAMDLKGIIR